jgi:hypothetical protein
MFVAGWTFGSKFMWELIFAVLLTWFLARGALSIRQFGIHLPHFLVHGVLSLAMILMYAFPGVPSGGLVDPMSMPTQMSGGSRLDPTVALFLALCLFASAIFTIGSSKKGASHHGSHALAYAGVSGGSLPQDRSKERHSYTFSIEGVVTTPWVEDASHVAMCVAMGFLLVLIA